MKKLHLVLLVCICMQINFVFAGEGGGNPDPDGYQSLFNKKSPRKTQEKERAVRPQSAGTKHYIERSDRERFLKEALYPTDLTETGDLVANTDEDKLEKVTLGEHIRRIIEKTKNPIPDPDTKLDISLTILEGELKKARTKLTEVVYDFNMKSLAETNQAPTFSGDDTADNYKFETIHGNEDFKRSLAYIWLEVMNSNFIEMQGNRPFEISVINYLIKHGTPDDYLAEKIRTLLEFGSGKNGNIKGDKIVKVVDLDQNPLYVTSKYFSPKGPHSKLRDINDSHIEFSQKKKGNQTEDDKLKKEILSRVRVQIYTVLEDDSIGFNQFLNVNPNPDESVAETTASDDELLKKHARIIARNKISESLSLDVQGKNENLTAAILRIAIADRDREAFDTILDMAEKKGITIVTLDKTNKATHVDNEMQIRMFDDLLSELMVAHNTLKLQTNKKVTVKDKSGRSREEYVKVDYLEEFFQNEIVLPLWEPEKAGKRYDKKFLDKVMKSMNIKEFVDEAYEIAADKRSTNPQKIFDALYKCLDLTWYRDRILLHLNRWTMMKGHQADKDEAPLIKLMHFLGRAKPGSTYSDVTNQKYEEIVYNGGREIIILNENELKWNPINFFIATHGSIGLSMLINSAEKNGIDIPLNRPDGMWYTPIHVLFLLDSYFSTQDENALNLLATDNQSAMNNLFEANSSMNIFKEGRDEAACQSLSDIFEIVKKKEDNTKLNELLEALEATDLVSQTPVTKALSTGNIKAFGMMKKFLVDNKRWSESSHGSRGKSLLEIQDIVTGIIINHPNTKDNLSEGKRKPLYELREFVDKRKQQLEFFKLYSYPSDENEIDESKVVDQIKAEVERVFKEFDDTKSTETKNEGVYEAAMAAGLNVIAPDQTALQENFLDEIIKDFEKMIKRAIAGKLRDIKDGFRFAFKSKEERAKIMEERQKHAEEEARKEIAAKITINQRIVFANPEVKASWINVVIEEVISRYYKDNSTSSAKIKLEHAYENLTGQPIKAYYFGTKFKDYQVEENAVKFIKNYLKDRGLLLIKKEGEEDEGNTRKVLTYVDEDEDEDFQDADQNGFSFGNSKQGF